MDYDMAILNYKKINLRLRVNKDIFLNENLLKKINKKQLF